MFIYIEYIYTKCTHRAT